jgi:sulfite reductase (NADPH) flavoprotein alpha-component
MSGRPYTISRLVRKNDGRTDIELTVSQVEKEIKSADGKVLKMPARTSSYLGRVESGDTIAAWVLPELHRFPVSLGRDVPTIVICTGSGISAPLSLLRSGAGDGPLWIIYGVRSWKQKSLYGEELSRSLADGRITRFDVAVSRPLEGEGPSRRVQDVLREVASEVGEWLRAGAHVYLSGRLSMGREVSELFVNLLVEENLAPSGDAARALLDTWRQTLRFQASVSGA